MVSVHIGSRGKKDSTIKGETANRSGDMLLHQRYRESSVSGTGHGILQQCMTAVTISGSSRIG